MGHEEGHTSSSENTLAQTPHDIVPGEPAPSAGGGATFEEAPDSHENGQGLTPATQDAWVILGANNDRLVRIHRTQRNRMFTPQACHDLLPLEQVDVQRITLTNLAEQPLLRFEYCWDGSAIDTRELEDFWVGETQSYLIPDKPPDGYVFVD